MGLLCTLKEAWTEPRMKRLEKGSKPAHVCWDDIGATSLCEPFPAERGE
jgi:hypothetical protein